MAISFFRPAEEALARDRQAAFTRLYLAIATGNAASVSRAARAVQEAEAGLARLVARRQAILDAQEEGGPALSLYDFAVDAHP